MKFWGGKGIAGESEPRTLPGYLLSQAFTQAALKKMQKTSGHISIDYSCYGEITGKNADIIFQHCVLNIVLLKEKCSVS